MTSIEETYKKEFPTLPEEEINTAVLKAAPWEDDERIEVSTKLFTEEYSSVCPWSGLPDYAKLEVEYSPKDKIVEMKSFKIYITSFRNVGITMEKACKRICKDLGELLQPRDLIVRMVFNARGGFGNEVIAEWYAQE